jgi:hypothetical protein
MMVMDVDIIHDLFVTDNNPHYRLWFKAVQALEAFSTAIPKCPREGMASIIINMLIITSLQGTLPHCNLFTL